MRDPYSQLPGNLSGHVQLARRMDIDMPITEEVYKILFEQKNPLVAVKELMLRGHKDELEQTD